MYLLKSGNSVYVTNLEKSNLIANAFSNAYQFHDYNVATSIDSIRNSVIELPLNVLVSPTEVRNTIQSL
jgi:hypothetical protein